MRILLALVALVGLGCRHPIRTSPEAGVETGSDAPPSAAPPRCGFGYTPAMRGWVLLVGVVAAGCETRGPLWGDAGGDLRRAADVVEVARDSGADAPIVLSLPVCAVPPGAAWAMEPVACPGQVGQWHCYSGCQVISGLGTVDVERCLIPKYWADNGVCVETCDGCRADLLSGP